MWVRCFAKAKIQFFDSLSKSHGEWIPESTVKIAVAGRDIEVTGFYSGRCINASKVGTDLRATIFFSQTAKVFVFNNGCARDEVGRPALMEGPSGPPPAPDRGGLSH